MYFIRKKPFVNLNANSQLTHHLPMAFSSNCNPAGIKSAQLQRTNSPTRSPHANSLSRLYGNFIAVLLEKVSFFVESRYIKQRKELPMIILAGTICIMLLLALAGANFLVDNISPDELSNMGIERKS